MGSWSKSWAETGFGFFSIFWTILKILKGSPAHSATYLTKEHPKISVLNRMLISTQKKGKSLTKMQWPLPKTLKASKQPTKQNFISTPRKQTNNTKKNTNPIEKVTGKNKGIFFVCVRNCNLKIQLKIKKKKKKFWAGTISNQSENYVLKRSLLKTPFVLSKIKWPHTCWTFVFYQTVFSVFSYWKSIRNNFITVGSSHTSLLNHSWWLHFSLKKHMAFC